MKILYKTPEITVEELTKADVLCASTPTTQTGQDNFVGSLNGNGGAGSNTFDFDLGGIVSP